MPKERVALSYGTRPRLHVSTSSGDVTVFAEEREDVVIDSGAPLRERITESRDEIRFQSARGGAVDLVVRCPKGAALVASTASGNLRLIGEFREVRANTASGIIDVDCAEVMDLRSISGKIRVGTCGSRLRLQSTSGDVEIGSADRAEVWTISGGVEVGEASSDIQVRSVSGKVEIGARGQGPVAVQTVSGSVRVELPEGTRPEAHLKSLKEPVCGCPPGSDCRVDVSSMTGNIEVVPQ